MWHDCETEMTFKRIVRALMLCIFLCSGLLDLLLHPSTVQAQALSSDPSPHLPVFSIEDMPPTAPTGYFVNSFFPSEAYKMIAGNRDTVFLTHYSELSRSTNGGVSWSSSSFPYTYDLVVSPEFSRDQRAFAAAVGSQNVIRLSSDGGQTWRASQAPLNVEVWALFVSPTFAVDQTIYATIKNGLMRSVDGGEHWESVTYPPISGGLTIYELLLSPYFANDKTLFARTSPVTNFETQELWRSTDGGMTWQPAHTGLYLESGNRLGGVAVIALGGGEIALIAATKWALLISFDFDGTWYVLSWDTIDQLYVPADFAWTGVMFAKKADYNLYRTQDFGKTWQVVFSNAGISLSPDYVSDRTLYAKTTYALWRSMDAGSTWSKQAENPPVYIQGINHRSFVFSPAFESDGTIYAIQHFSWNDNCWILKSTDAGRHWRVQFLPFTSNSMNQLAFSPQFATDHTIFMIFGSNMYRSTDAGENWSRVKGYNTIPLTYGSSPVSLVVSPNYAQDNTLFVGTSSDGLYRSTDGGAHWTLLKTFQDLRSFILSPGYPQDPTLYALFFDLSRDLVLERSLDGGVTWQRLPLIWPGYYYPQMYLSPNFLNDNTLFVCLFGYGGILRSTDRGDHFTQVPGTEGAVYFHISPHYQTDRTLVTDLGITEDDGAHWFPLEQSQTIGGIGYWQNRLTMVMFHPGVVDYADPYQGLYYYRWPNVQPPPSLIGFGIDPDVPVPVQVNVRLGASNNRTVPWDVDGSAPWLTLSHISGTTPSTLTLTADPGGETITVGSMQTPITVTFYLSYRLQRSYPVFTKTFLVNARVYLPLTMRSYKPPYTSSALQTPYSPPMQGAETINHLKLDAFVTFQKQE